MVSGRRERGLAAALCEGLLGRAIARNFDITEKAVKAHVGTIFQALRVVNRTQAAISGRQAGLI
ncbi:MAG: LuxR C-terminal-related transcriptional regulator [Variibacter sp.]